MKEMHLHYLYDSRKLGDSFITTEGKKLEILDFGKLNKNSGPDFKGAKLRLEDKIWSGNIEFHLKSSDWYRHNHQDDRAYDNVIAHFVYEHDMEVFSNGYSLPTIEIASIVPPKEVSGINDFFSRKSRIVCASAISRVEESIINAQMEVAFEQRMKRKEKEVLSIIKQNRGDHFRTLLVLFARAFGGKVNQFAFTKLVDKIDIQQLFQINLDAFKVSALLHGTSGLLPQTVDDVYTMKLKQEFTYQQHLFCINPLSPVEWNTATFRPASFPSFRIEQFGSVLINLLKGNRSINISNYSHILRIETNSFWSKHYHFNKSCSPRKTDFTKGFIEHLLINVVIPFNLAISSSKQDRTQYILHLNAMMNISAEKNSIMNQWKNLGVSAASAKESQALIEQKNEFCNRKKCLFCKVGRKLLTE
jgi:hypothetical protein